MLNPILVKELRSQARGQKFCTALYAYIIVISGVVLGMIWEAAPAKETFEPRRAENMLLTFIMIMVSAVCMICPAFSVSAISSEREQQTLELLRATLLKPHHVLIGKALPAVFHALILLFVSSPIAMLIIPASETSLKEVAVCYLIAFVSASAFSIIAVVWSSVFRRTRTAAGISYISIGFLAFGTVTISPILSKVFRVELNRTLSDLFVVLSPFYAICSSLGREIGTTNVFGLPILTAMIASYLIMSVIAISIAFFMLRRIAG